MLSISRVIQLAGAVMALSTGAAMAQYPSKAITIMVPYAAGGSTDVVSRVLADELMKVWDQPVVVDNRPGGGTVVGTLSVAQAEPDGYEWAIVSNAFTTNAALREALPYDTLGDFRGITVFVNAPSAIAAHPTFPPKNLAELVEYAKSNTVTYAATLGGPSHMFAELLQYKTGITLEHIPYSSQSEAMPDILAGRVDLQIGGWPNTRQYVETGQLNLISIINDTRVPDAPEWPTAAEEVPELEGMPMGSWTGVVVPAGVPDEVVAEIWAGVQAAITSDSFRQRVIELGSEPGALTPEETDAHLRAEVELWKEIARAANLSLD